MTELIFDHSHPGRSNGAQMLPPAPEPDDLPEALRREARPRWPEVSELQAANPDVDPRALRPGQKLKLRRDRQAARESAPSEDNPPAESGQLETSSEAAIAQRKPVVRSIRIDDEITFGDFASRHGMETGKLNALNGLHLEPSTLLAKGSELYVSAQP